MASMNDALSNNYTTTAGQELRHAKMMSALNPRTSLLDPQRSSLLARTLTDQWIGGLSPERRGQLSGVEIQRPPPMPDPRFDPADPNMASRGTILPIGRTESGEMSLAAPQIALDMFGSAQLPSAVLKGYDPTFEDTAQMSMDTMMAGGLLGRGPAGALGANVWHGSPHRWAPEPDFPQGRPRLDKIGTGEGAQAYGHGIYVADAKGVANTYAEGLPKNAAFDGKTIYEIDTSTLGDGRVSVNAYTNIPNPGGVGGRGSWAPKELADEYASVEEALAALKKTGLVPDNAPQWTDRVSGHTEISSQGANLYKLDLPDEDVAKMLDWDAPLSEQSEAVRNALDPAMIGKLVWQAAKAEDAPKLAKRWENSVVSGRDIYQIDPNMTGADIYRGYARGFGEKSVDASEALRKAGIPGLKYYDQGSRAVGGYPNAQGTAARLLDSAGGDPQKAIELAKNRIKAGNMPDVPDSGLRQAIKYLEEVGEPRTRNYVTWDQDVLDRTKMLEGGGMDSPK